MIRMLDRAVGAVWLGMLTFGAGMTTIAQGVFMPDATTLERWVGGGSLVVVALIIVRWSRQMSQEVRTTLTTSLDRVQATLDQTVEILETERQAWASERRDIKVERDTLRHELLETYALLKEERNLRISLEKAGVTDRRTDGDTTASEARDLG